MQIEHKLILKGAQPAPVEFPTMMAGLLTAQAGSATVAAQIHHDVARGIAHSREEAMATLMQANPGWRAAAGVLKGSFHPGVARLLGDNSL